MKDFINKWLAGKRNYLYGTILYQKYGADEALKKLFQNRTNYTEAKLLECLQQLVSDEVIAPAPIVSTAVMPDSTDKTEQALKDQWMPLYTKMNYLRHQLDIHLDDLSEDADIARGRLAKDILQLEKDCMAIWMQRNFYRAHGNLPGKSSEEKEPVIDDFKAGRRIETLKIYLRRYKGYLAKEPGNANHAEKLKQYEKEFNQLNTIHG